MYVDLTCTCECTLQIDSTDENALWALVYRFANAHGISCGYVSSFGSAEQPDTGTRKMRVIRPKSETPEETL